MSCSLLCVQTGLTRDPSMWVPSALILSKQNIKMQEGQHTHTGAKQPLPPLPHSTGSLMLPMHGT